MELQFFGAAGGTTGTSHMIRANDSTVLLDCGLFQGRRWEARERNARFDFAAAKVDAVVLSHAHMDHAGKIPMLVREGFNGAVHCTHATRDLGEVMLYDCAHILMKDAEFLNYKRIREKARSRRKKRRKVREQVRSGRGRDFDELERSSEKRRLPEDEVVPLYLAEDVKDALKLFVLHSYGEWFEAAPGMRFRFHDAGHILGSAWVEAEVGENGRTRRLVFTGDYGRRDMPILCDPEPLVEADIYLSESTYGNRTHPEFEGMETDLAAAVNRMADRGRGILVIPAFAVGRTQNLLYSFDRIFASGLAPQVPVVVDSPLATTATRITIQHQELFDEQAREAAARYAADGGRVPWLRFTESVDESKALNRESGPLVIISASGMMESGRVLHHLANHISKPDTEILIVGFQAESTLGRRLVEGAKKVNILGDSYPVRARVTAMLGFSAHADRNDLLRILSPHADRAEALFLIHGEDDQREPLADELSHRGFRRIEMPVEKQIFRFQP